MCFDTYVIVGPPVFVTKPSTQRVKQGETALFKTQIDGWPTPKMSWLLNGKPLITKEDIQVQFDDKTGQANLTIQNVDLKQHAGSIICHLENLHGNQEETVQLDILVAPKIVTQLPQEQETVNGQDVMLRVIARGSPQPHVQWTFNNKFTVAENASVNEVKNEYQLLIKQATVAQNEGIYQVVLKNEVGEVLSTPCAVTVLGPVKLTRVRPTADIIDLKIGEKFEITVDIDVNDKEILLVSLNAFPY
ncbi:unnamed protein product [Rotaria sp. Silwood2]|nr:unnamed protein product [Rotaria sp. Silwood2]CAF2737804.1 unnamed protein product [Rotaria sp. Silwood2]CAF2991049.1 unnamed protein product [Rotaria sp. Silwood2]CAF3128888.1 unnamed protein product [Rotaria sp. Silwood2]CAF4395611.1 unnamed protein product [Rotaria sp. Silwood2]